MQSTSWPDVVNNAIKFLAAGALLGILVYLTVIGKADSSILVSLVSAALGGLGVHSSSGVVATRVAGMLAKTAPILLVCFLTIGLSACGGLLGGSGGDPSTPILIYGKGKCTITGMGNMALGMASGVNGFTPGFITLTEQSQ